MCFACPLIYSPSLFDFPFFLILNHTFQISRLFIKKVIRMKKNIGEYLSRKSTEVIAIVACIGLVITIILAAGSIRNIFLCVWKSEKEKWNAEKVKRNETKCLHNSNKPSTFAPVLETRRDGRVVDCGGLENRWTERFRGFESLFLRWKQQKLLFTFYGGWSLPDLLNSTEKERCSSGWRGTPGKRVNP